MDLKVIRGVKSSVFISFIIISVLLPVTFDSTKAIKTELPVGTQAVDFTLTSIPDNTTFSLSDFLGKIVLLDLFATWCGFCKAALPYINRIANSYEDLVVISIDVDSRETEELVIEFKNEFNMTWIVALDNNSIISSNYGTGAIPTMYVINQTGYVHYQEIGFDNDKVVLAINQLLDDIPPQIKGVQIYPKTSPVTLYDNELTVTCENISDNLGIQSVYLSVSTDTIQQNYAIFEFNGSINANVKIDPKQLYLQNSISVSLVVVDLAGNQQATDSEEISVEGGDTDKKPPVIKEVIIDFSLKGSYYLFNVTLKVTDDVFVYKIEATLREGTKPQTYLISSFERDPTDITIFHGMISIQEDQITNPEDVTAKIVVEDLGKHQTFYPGTSSTSTNSFDFLIFLVSFLFIWTSIRKRNRR